MIWSSQTFAKKWNQPGAAREAAIMNEVLNGNIPSDTWDLLPVTTADGKIVAQVIPDYFRIGTDEDNFRCPMTPYLAQNIANLGGWKFPTPALVDLIWKSAHIKLEPITPNWNYVPPITGSLTFRYLDHSHQIQEQINQPYEGRIIAGHKKDIVSDVALLRTYPLHVVIYGWQQYSGKPIQGETTVHDRNYVDYSHGARYVLCDDPKLAGPCSIDNPPADFLTRILK